MYSIDEWTSKMFDETKGESTMEKVTRNIVIEGAQLIFPNFSGKAGKYNKEGDRSFGVILPEYIDIPRLEQEGWNVRWLKPRDEYEEPTPYMQVAVSFKGKPPKIVMIQGGRKVPLDEDSVRLLDFAELETVDLVIRPYNWTAQGREGVKGYLKTLYATIMEDEFAEKYRDSDE